MIGRRLGRAIYQAAWSAGLVCIYCLRITPTMLGLTGVVSLAVCRDCAERELS